MAQEGGPQDRADEWRSWLILNEPDDHEIYAQMIYDREHYQPIEDERGISR